MMEPQQDSHEVLLMAVKGAGVLDVGKFHSPGYSYHIVISRYQPSINGYPVQPTGHDTWGNTI